MKMITFTVLGMAMFSFSGAAFADQAADEAAIRLATQQRDTAANTKDAEVYLSYIDEDCTAGWDGNQCAGAVRATGEFPAMWINARTEIAEGGEIVFVTPDVAIYRYTLHRSGFLDRSGKPIPPGNAQAVMLYVKKEGKWMLLMGGLAKAIDQANTN